MTESAALLTDNSLTDAARIVGVYLALMGDGWHELKYDEVARILHGYPSADTVGKHVRMLVAAGWVERTSGGRGHGDRYRWTGRKLSPPLATPSNKETPEHTPPLQAPSKNRTEFSPPRQAPSKTDSPPLQPGGKSPVVVEDRDEVGDEGRRARAHEESHALSERATELIEQHDEDFTGFRGALRDYLQARVPTDRQYGYLQTLAGWLAGRDPSVFKFTTGSRAPPEEIPSLLASAFNELLAGDETRMKRPIGDVGNLKTKLSILCQQRGNHGKPHGSSGKDRGSDGNGAATPARRAKPIPVEG